MANGSRESAFTWVFGTAALGAEGQGEPNHVLGSTGDGEAFNTYGHGASFSFFIETNAASTGSYQIRTALKAAGPWSVLSSGTVSTSAMDVVQLPGPLQWLSPRLKTLNSTANQIVVRMVAL